MRRQIQISPGVYVTDFRQNCELKGLNTQPQPKIKHVGLIIDKLASNQSKIEQLLYSIEAIKQQQDWETDQVLLEAIEQDYQQALRFSTQMKQSILELTSLKYQPENDKVQELINPLRITDRENLIRQQYKQFIQKYGVSQFAKQEQPHKQKIIEVEEQTEKSKTKKQSDQGIYV